LISNLEQNEIIQSLSNIPSDINISLKDGQLDTFITLQTSGLNHKIDIPRTGIQRSLESMSQKIRLSAIAFIFLGLLAAAFFSKRLSKPLREIELASKHVGRGEFGFQISELSKFQSIEMQNATKAFNEMSLKINSLRNENEKLQKQAQLSELSEITRALAHTIRNPLNTLNLAIDELSTDISKQSRDELNNISKHQIKRIDRWVRSLMEVLSNDNILVEPINVLTLVEEVLSDIKLGLANNTNIRFRISTQKKNGEKLDYCMDIIKPEVKSILLGLITNAVESISKDFTEDESLVEITVDGKHGASNSIQITISDRGKGIEQKIKDKMFSPHNTDKTYGAGMGLYLAHRIVTLKYDGQIEILDNPPTSSGTKIPGNNGTKVILTLKNRA
ncbi:MAG: HAMP domain-containing histidine kinase, partial [Kangiellaceae bacterium]|nr:HAMP domain-containing histidine kinase [Kangiellaceae bacterium]